MNRKAGGVLLVLVILTTLSSYVSYAAVPDADGDGVPDANDKCPNSLTSSVDPLGCSCEEKLVADCSSLFIGAQCCVPDSNPCTDDCGAGNIGIGLVGCNYVDDTNLCAGGSCYNGVCRPDIAREQVTCVFKKDGSGGYASVGTTVSSSSAATGNTVQGFLDDFNPESGLITGWAVDTAYPNFSSVVRLWVDQDHPFGRPFDFAEPVLRQDINQVYGITGQHGFVFFLNKTRPEFRHGGRQRVYAYFITAQGEWVQLDGSPRWVTMPGPLDYDKVISEIKNTPNLNDELRIARDAGLIVIDEDVDPRTILIYSPDNGQLLLAITIENQLNDNPFKPRLSLHKRCLQLNGNYVDTFVRQPSSLLGNSYGANNYMAFWPEGATPELTDKFVEAMRLGARTYIESLPEDLIKTKPFVSLRMDNIEEEQDATVQIIFSKIEDMSIPNAIMSVTKFHELEIGNSETGLFFPELNGYYYGKVSRVFLHVNLGLIEGMSIERMGKVIIHEFMHMWGLSDSNDPTSFMYKFDNDNPLDQRTIKTLKDIHLYERIEEDNCVNIDSGVETEQMPTSIACSIGRCASSGFCELSERYTGEGCSNGGACCVPSQPDASGACRYGGTCRSSCRSNEQETGELCSISGNFGACCNSGITCNVDDLNRKCDRIEQQNNDRLSCTANVAICSCACTSDCLPDRYPCHVYDEDACCSGYCFSDGTRGTDSSLGFCR